MFASVDDVIARFERLQYITNRAIGTVVYLATAPKSNRVYLAWGAAQEAAREFPAEGVPLHIRNAPTPLMKDLGYGKGYQYAHDVPDAYTPQRYLPDALEGSTFYEPGTFGFERDIAKRMAWWRDLMDRARGATPPDADRVKDQESAE